MNRVAAFLVLAALSTAAGCGTEPPVAAEPPPLASLLATLSPTASPPGRVVNAAVQAYISGVNRALRSGDTSAGVKASTTGCGCRAELAAIAKFFARGNRFVGTRVVVVALVPVNVRATTAETRLTYRIPASTVATANGARRRLPARPTTTVTARVTLLDGRWLVSALGPLLKVKPAAAASPSASPRHSPSPSPSG